MLLLVLMIKKEASAVQGMHQIQSASKEYRQCAMQSAAVTLKSVSWSLRIS